MNNLNKLLLIINEKDLNLKIGDLDSFLNSEPQKYFNHDVAIETYQVLNTINKDDFINNFEEIKDYLFSFINSYYHVIDIYNELDDISFDDEIKIKIYYLPIITQIIENIFSNFYRIVCINGVGTSKISTTIDNFKTSLKEQLGYSLNIIDKDLRNAMNHGKITINQNVIIFPFKNENNNYKIESKRIILNDLINLKNQLIDSASATFFSLFVYLNKIDFFDEFIFKNKDDFYTNNELLKLHLKSSKIEIKNIKCINSTLEVSMHINNIENEYEIYTLSIDIIKILYQYYNFCTFYTIDYSYDYSPNGKMIFNENLEVISQFIHDIEKMRISPKSYKYHNFKEIKYDDWEVKNISDISVENIKGLRGKLFIKKEKISKDELKKIFHKATKEVRGLPTLQNPKDTRAKYVGDADIVYLNVFYDNLKRVNYGHEELSDTFICNLTYYRTKNTPIPDYPFESKHIKEEIPKHTVWWKNSEIKSM